MKEIIKRLEDIKNTLNNNISYEEKDNIIKYILNITNNYIDSEELLYNNNIICFDNINIKNFDSININNTNVTFYYSSYKLTNIEDISLIIDFIEDCINELKIQEV